MQKCLFYPPGINLINCGELITENIIKKIQDGMINGLEVIGLEIDNRLNDKFSKQKATYEAEIYRLWKENDRNIENHVNKKEK